MNKIVYIQVCVREILSLGTGRKGRMSVITSNPKKLCFDKINQVKVCSIDFQISFLS